MQACAGNTACESMACWRAFSLNWTMSGSCPVDRPARNFSRVSSYSIWFTRLTRTSSCELLNWSVSATSVSSRFRRIECQYTISTGLSALSSAFSGHFGSPRAGAAPAPAVTAPAVRATAVVSAAASTRRRSRVIVTESPFLLGGSKGGDASADAGVVVLDHLVGFALGVVERLLRALVAREELGLLVVDHLTHAEV